MSSASDMQPFLDELKRREDDGNPITFWLRDDDAIEPSDALDRFNSLTKAYSIPATVAVIPETTGQTLVENLRAMSHIHIAVHGWSHGNHAPESEKKQELGSHRPIDEVLAELSKGFKRLSSLYTNRFVPLLVPPWNRIADDVVSSLGSLGFKGLSTFGLEKPTPIKMINTHIDLIDWKGSRGGRNSDQLIGEFIRCSRATGNPVGFLTHHLVHDAAAWAFMENLFEASGHHGGCRWVSSEEILNDSFPDPRFPAE